MSEPMLGEIRVFPFPWTPKGWAQCDGSLLKIRQNQVLYALLGTAFGGDGETTFGLPDLRGRAILGAQSLNLPNTTAGARGHVSGTETVTLTAEMTPPHSHAVVGTSTVGTAVSMAGGVLASAAFKSPNPSGLIADVYGIGSTKDKIPYPALLNEGSVSITGAGAAHENMQPFLVCNPCICVAGVCPARP